VSQLIVEKLVEPRAVKQLDAFEAGLLFARTEGFIPAPETTNALAAVIEEAHKAREEGKEKVIVVNFSGHGLLDLAGYEQYVAGKLTNLKFDDRELKRVQTLLKDYPKPELLKQTPTS